ncbi:2-dehydro-3-deoxygalactonokinase [Mixta mediterraneensis]|uniref:2-dehydro-3-deoxygalactonokinase n=1 Tax=Mixta mediterraneensis TaxID=2758443 RepID=UPI00187406F3|nr:2-dehydro-3-deoxygalactonokinase [Mixta mediterraneensis]MBE5254468.1 2-dehydro-3-deoxygalactonokinase [Mixta mediterraneensis]
MNYIAVDWGTSNFRALSVRDGVLIKSVQDSCGVGKCQQDVLPGMLKQQLLRLDDAYDEQLPVLLCGMIGSNIGIADAGYLDMPLSFSQLLGKGMKLPGILPNPLTLRPGICDKRVNEICRGEEMQLAGALTLSDASTFAAVGTHSKWLKVKRSQQQVTGLQTLITGELYHLLLKHSVVGKGLPEQIPSTAAFQAGVERALSVVQEEAELVTELFRCRGRYILDALAKEDAASWLSGLLMGYEIARGHPGGNKTVCFIGSETLLPHYQQACEISHLRCEVLPAESAMIAGLNEVFRHGE